MDDRDDSDDDNFEKLFGSIQLMPSLTVQADSNAWKRAAQKQQALSQTSIEPTGLQLDWGEMSFDFTPNESPSLFKDEANSSTDKDSVQVESDLPDQLEELTPLVQEALHFNGRISSQIFSQLIERHGAPDQLVDWVNTNTPILSGAHLSAKNATNESNELFIEDSDSESLTNFLLAIHSDQQRSENLLSNDLHRWKLKPKAFTPAIEAFTQSFAESLESLCKWDRGLRKYVESIGKTIDIEPEEDTEQDDDNLSSALEAATTLATNLVSLDHESRKQLLTETRPVSSSIIEFPFPPAIGTAASAFDEAKQRLISSRNALVMGAMYLAEGFADGYSHEELCRDEIISECAIALCKAIDNYNPSLTNNFISYCWWKCRSHMQRRYTHLSLFIRLPIRVHESLFTFPTKSEKLLADHHLDWFKRNLANAPQQTYSTRLSTSIPVNTPRAYTDFEDLDDEREEDPDDLREPLRNAFSIEPSHDTIIAKIDIQRALEQINPKFADVLKKRFGIGGEFEMTLEEIGQVVGVTRERIRQMETKALAQVRHVLTKAPSGNSPETQPETPIGTPTPIARSTFANIVFKTVIHRDNASSSEPQDTTPAPKDTLSSKLAYDETFAEHSGTPPATNQYNNENPLDELTEDIADEQSTSLVSLMDPDTEIDQTLIEILESSPPPMDENDSIHPVNLNPSQSANDMDTKQRLISIPPNPTALMDSLRGVGYSTEKAIADLIDNSISAGATEVFVWVYKPESGSEMPSVAILDDGSGMDKDELISAMKVGVHGPNVKRNAKDLGRFGMGMKTASLSQAKSLTVLSKQDQSDPASMSWDLDFLRQRGNGDWLAIENADIKCSNPMLERFDATPKGTVVLWQKLDRMLNGSLSSDAFLELLDKIRQHLAMTFHRFIESKKLRIFVNNLDEPIQQWSPFELAKTHSATDRLTGEAGVNLTVQPRDQDPYQIKIQMFILPHKDRLTPQQYEDASGPNGWTAQQGFYIYRNNRLLVSGGWLGLGKWHRDELHKLLRISIDIPNEADHDWGIDIMKSTAKIPVQLKKQLTELVSKARKRSLEVFAYRGTPSARVPRNQQAASIEPIWQAKNTAQGQSYHINRSHPLIKHLLEQSGDNANLLSSAFKAIENTVPVQRIWLDVTEKEGVSTAQFTEEQETEMSDLMVRFYNSLINKGYSPEAAKNYISCSEPYSNFPHLIEALK